MASENQSFVEFPVYLEESQEIITLFLTPEDVARATEDEAFLRVLISQEHEKAASEYQENQENAIPNDQEDISAEKESATSDSSVWGDKAVFAFLELYRERQNEFNETKRHNKIWEEMASDLRLQNPTFNKTGQQCSVKMAGLKRTYKNIKDQNSKSGNCRTSWTFFSVMDSLFGAKKYMNPPAVASSDGPLDRPGTSKEQKSLNESIQPEKKRRVEVVLSSFINDIKSNREEQVRDRLERERKKEMRYEEQRRERQAMHKEKLEVQKSMLKMLDALVNKN